MDKIFESFRSFLENDRSGFLSSHLENPQESTTFLVFADWLDDHDDPVVARILRALVKGHDESTVKAWKKSIGDDLVNLYTRSNIEDTDYNKMTFTIHDDPRTFRIGSKGIETGKTKFKSLPRSEWTNQIVDAAVFVLVQHYLHTPAMLYRQDYSTETTERAEGMHNRFIDSLTNQIGHLVNEFARNLQLVSHDSSRARINSLKRDYDYLEGLLRKWNSVTEGKELSKDYPSLCRNAFRLRELITGLQRTINYQYGFLLPLNWVTNPTDLVSAEMRKVLNKIETSCA